ncbi:MAG: RelA/SpoT domain-containing protein, partial [Clostridiales bacterium]|nr:RelA/SpoT domain-containing protein [Clostridiales bacterium]
ENIREDYVALCDTLTQALESVSKPVCPSVLIQGRAKKPDSFTEKCARKAEKYKKSHFKMMTDLCGTRVILQTTGQVADFCELLEQYFDIDWENSENAGSRLGNDQFGYISQHFIVSLKPETANILGVEIDTYRFNETKMKAEIQVRTLAQHINADTLHDRLYKSTVKPLDEHWREGSKIAAMAEVLDSNLRAFVDKYDRYSLHQQSYMSAEQTEEELRILKAMNFMETYPFTRFTNALKMAAYHRNLGQYPEIAALLEPFVREEGKGELKLDTMYQTRLWFEYGLALLALNRQINKANDYIFKALDNYVWLETDRSELWQEARRFYAFIALTAGTLAHKRDWLDRALRVDFTNPYACAELLSHTGLDHSLLQGAVSVAEDHLRGGVNEPEVYFALGRLWLALNGEEQSAHYYVDGLLFYLSETEKGNARVQQILEREKAYLREKRGAVPALLYELMNIVYNRIYDGEPVIPAETVWTPRGCAVLEESAKGREIRRLNAGDALGRVKELIGARGYLFLEDDEELLAKAALILGIRVISTCRPLNIRFATQAKIRKTGGFCSLPCERESLAGLFTKRESYLSAEQIEAVAKNAHERYVNDQRAKDWKPGKTPVDFGERAALWGNLKETYKKANLDQAAYAPIVFGALGYVFNDEKDGALGFDSFTAEEQEFLAKTEHGRWNAERVMSGWCYYPKRDNEKLLHNLIVAWDELSKDDQYLDKSVLSNFEKTGLYLHKQ